MLGYHALMVIVFLIGRNGFPVRMLFQGRGWKWPLAAGLLGLGGGALLYLLWPLLALPISLDTYIQAVGLTRDSFPWFMVYFIAINPFVEELYWRGWLGSDLKRPVLNDLFFAGYHPLVLAGAVEPVWLLVILIFITAGAWLWRQLDRYNGGLRISVISHLSADAAVMVTAWLLLNLIR